MRISDWSSDVCSSDLTIKDGRVEQSNFHDYPAIMLAEVPPVDVFLIPGDQIPGGAGEIGVPVIAPALTASIFALTGKHIRSLPVSKHLDRKSTRLNSSH